MLASEKSYLLDDHGLTVGDSGIQAEIGTGEASDKRLTLVAFLESHRVKDTAKRQPILLYLGAASQSTDSRTYQEQIGLIEEWAALAGRDFHLDLDDTAALRALTGQDVLVVTCQRLMRGFDYRTTSGRGISLFVGCLFNSKRAYFQGCGRVGRYGESCRRVVSTAIEGVPYLNNLAAINEKIGRVRVRRATVRRERSSLEPDS